MDYTRFFTNRRRKWVRTEQGVYQASGYILSLDSDPKYPGSVWNLYKFDRTAPDCWRCIAHNIPFSYIPDDLPA